MTELQALNKSIKLWKWLVLNPTAEKQDYPDYPIIRLNLDNCPLCEKYRGSHNTCKGCCLNRLKKSHIFSVYRCCDSYHIWTKSLNPKLRTKAAEKILSTMIKRRDKIKGAKL